MREGDQTMSLLGEFPVCEQQMAQMAIEMAAPS